MAAIDLCPEEAQLHERQMELLAKAWERARLSDRYCSLPAFSQSAFTAIDVTSKAEFKTDAEAFWSADPSACQRYYQSTGTSGEPTGTYRTAEDLLWNYAGVARRWGKVIEPKDRCATLLPSDVVAVGDLISGVCEIIGACSLRCYPFAQGVMSWERLAQLLADYAPTVLWSSPGTLIQVMRVLKERGAFPALREPVERVMLLGEVVSPRLRSMLAREWQAQVWDASYGSTESGTIAACDGGDGLRVLEYSYLCELLTEQGLEPLRDGRSGELVITTLNAFARPLLRVSTGDFVTVKRDLSEGGTRLSVHGRSEEQLRFRGRSYLNLQIEDAVFAVPGVLGYLLGSSGEDLKSVVLERDPDFAGQDDRIHRQAGAEFARIGLAPQIKLVSQLPLSTKSGAGLKSWKRTNVRRA